MCKICDKCKSVMNYDPYFEAEVCVNCGKIERKERKKRLRKIINLQQWILLGIFWELGLPEFKGIYPFFVFFV